MSLLGASGLREIAYRGHQCAVYLLQQMTAAGGCRLKYPGQPFLNEFLLEMDCDVDAFIARALAQKADIYLMDEPFKGVDAATEKAIIGLLKELRSSGKTVVAVHHDLSTVSDYFDWVTLINMKVVANGEVKKVFTDENLNLTYRAVKAGGTV